MGGGSAERGAGADAEGGYGSDKPVAKMDHFKCAAKWAGGLSALTSPLGTTNAHNVRHFCVVLFIHSFSQWPRCELPV